MKKLKSVIFIIASIGIITACGSNKSVNLRNYQSFKKFNNDTLNYIESNFYENKKKYEQKELNILLNKFEIPIRSYSPIFNINEITGIYISLFYTLKEKKDKLSNKEKTHNLIIEFENPIPEKEISNMLFKNKGVWTKDEEKFFGKKIIKDIDIMKYDK